jgi:hypothetical protein
MTSIHVAKANDLFRTTMITTPWHKVMLTQSVSCSSNRETIVTAVRAFKKFTKGNDPYGQHDFGEVEVKGEKYYFKIDYLDKNLEFGLDPLGPEQVVRVLTIMHVSDY